MFSGIVEEMGTVEAIKTKKNLSVLKVRANKVVRGTKKGASICVDGACLTVTNVRKNVLEFDIMHESLKKTTLGFLKSKDRVNLERALQANSRIDGHFVTGHVDNIATIKEKLLKPNYTELRIGLTNEIRKFIVPKGSICLDGVSLTVGDVKKNYFSVYLIPFSKKVTTLGNKVRGDLVNVETDILAKYIFNKNSNELFL